MKSFARILLACGITLGILISSSISFAQQKSSSAGRSFATPQSYDVTRELALIGNVAEYVSSSKMAPLGPRATIQTAAGPVEVQLGSSRFLDASHFSLAPGDSVRIIGEYVANGQSTIFLARIIQKGGQSLTVRSLRGIPIMYASPQTKAGSAAKTQGGVL